MIRPLTASKSIPRSKRSRVVETWVFAVCLVALLVGAVPRECIGAESVTAERRRLGGHLFPASSIVPTPFITSYMTNRTGGGILFDLEIPLRDLDGELIETVTGDIAFFTLGLAGQWAARDWLALHVSLDGAARVGVNAASILSEGVSATRSAHFGGRAKLWNNDKAQVAATADYTPGNVITVSLRDFIEAVVDSCPSIEDCSISDAKGKLVASHGGSTWTGGLNGAYGFHPAFGARAFVEVGYTVPPSDDVDGETQVILGGAIGYDLNVQTPLPYVVTLEEKYRSAGNAQFASASDTILGIRYSGRDAFSYGLEVGVLSVESRDSGTKYESISGSFVLHYFF